MVKSYPLILFYDIKATLFIAIDIWSMRLYGFPRWWILWLKWYNLLSEMLTTNKFCSFARIPWDWKHGMTTKISCCKICQNETTKNMEWHRHNIAQSSIKYITFNLAFESIRRVAAGAGNKKQSIFFTRTIFFTQTEIYFSFKIIITILIRDAFFIVSFHLGLLRWI